MASEARWLARTARLEWIARYMIIIYSNKPQAECLLGGNASQPTTPLRRDTAMARFCMKPASWAGLVLGITGQEACIPIPGQELVTRAHKDLSIDNLSLAAQG